MIRITVTNPEHIGQEFFRFEMATAVAGAVMGINPFDQPDVESAKIKTKELTSAFEKSGKLPSESAVATDGEIDIYTDAKNADALRKAGANGSTESWLKAHFGRIQSGDYAAILAYLDHNEADTSAAQEMRMAIRDKKHVATCVGFDLASCTRPDKPTKVDRTPASSCRSQPTTPTIFLFPVTRRVSA